MKVYPGEPESLCVSLGMTAAVTLVFIFAMAARHDNKVAARDHRASEVIQHHGQTVAPR